VIGSPQRPLPDNTQHSQQTDIYAPDGIRTRIPNKRAAADTSLKTARPLKSAKHSIYIKGQGKAVP